MGNGSSGIAILFNSNKRIEAQDCVFRGKNCQIARNWVSLFFIIFFIYIMIGSLLFQLYVGWSLWWQFSSPWKKDWRFCKFICDQFLRKFLDWWKIHSLGSGFGIYQGKYYWLWSGHVFQHYPVVLHQKWHSMVNFYLCLVGEFLLRISIFRSANSGAIHYSLYGAFSGRNDASFRGHNRGNLQFRWFQIWSEKIFVWTLTREPHEHETVPITAPFSSN